MMTPTLSSPIWSDIAINAEQLSKNGLQKLFSLDPARAANYQQSCGGIHLDYSKNFFDAHTQSLFIKLMEQSNIAGQALKMFTGEKINNTEDRAVLHTLLRSTQSPTPVLNSEFSEVKASLEQVASIAHRVRNGQWNGATGKTIKHIVHIGIGGSYLGPKMVDEALASKRHKGHDLTCDYVANVDAHHIDSALSHLDPEATIVIIVSKSFATLETKANADTAKKWLQEKVPDLSKHLIAVTTNISAAIEFGIDKANILPMWDWVGGRYSVWSAVGLPIAIRYGFETFEALLAGAAEMDEHFLTSPPEKNIPMLLAFLGVLYQQCFNASSHAVLTYDHRLRYLPDHLQQVDMESNGKSVSKSGDTLKHPSGMIIWGGEGTNGQHAFHQLLHQGSYFVSTDFIMTLRPDHNLWEHHDKLIASCLSQSQALMVGRALHELNDEPSELNRKHKVMPGNKPSNTIVLEQLDAHTVGALIAMYEHKVFVQGMLWDTNPFDQWGVELGKELGDKILGQLSTTDSETPNAHAGLDGSTQNLLSMYLKAKETS